MTYAVVLDNSAVCRFHFREKGWRNVEPLIQAVRSQQMVAYAPPHLLVEFFQVARRKTVGHADSGRSLKKRYDWLMELRIQYVGVDYLADARDLRLLVNQGAGSYDAIYLHLALQRDLPLCTCDKGIVALQSRIPRLKVLDLDQTAFTG